MPSELQRVAQALVECLDQVPQMVEYLQRLAQQCRDNAGYLADISNHPAARTAALELDMAARCCDDAAHLLSLTPLHARAWAMQMVGGQRTSPGPSLPETVRPSRTAGGWGSTASGDTGGAGSGAIDVATILERLPERVARPGQKTKTRGIWIDDTGQEHELVSGQHEPEHQAAQQYAEQLGLMRSPAQLATAADVELKFAMRMRREGITSATIVLNNRPCPGALGCNALLPRFLPPGSELTIYAPDGFKKTYRAQQDDR